MRCERPFAAAINMTDSPLFEALRQWRSNCAREQGVPAYVILHDRSLHELAARQPQSINDLLNVPGIGQAKANRYGTVILELVASEGRPNDAHLLASANG